MKWEKPLIFLFICLIALYGWIGYQVIHTTDLPQCQPEGSLSDVAEEVIAIPLKTNGHCSLNKIKMIKRDREDIFLVSDRQLYHFNSSGQFLGQNNGTSARNETASRTGWLCGRSCPRPAGRDRHRTWGILLWLRRATPFSEYPPSRCFMENFRAYGLL